MAVKTLEFRDGCLWMVDQTKLPLEVAEISCVDAKQVAEAIANLRVRGAPAIGLAAAYGVVLAAVALADGGAPPESFRSGIEDAIAMLGGTRPTAVNLFWALQRMRLVFDRNQDAGPSTVTRLLRAEADSMVQQDLEVNQSMARHGASLIPEGANILTHCNAGALATGAYGTALGVMRAAHEQGKRIHVWVDETRPLLQGARLTTWELRSLGIPHTLIADNMAGHFMARGDVDLVMVGADRIAANGDSANKIGTYGAAVLARAHGIPFYFVAPTSTIDLSISSGAEIPIEERDPNEVLQVRGSRIAPDGTRAANPAFDVTPAALIAAIVTEHGLVRPPFTEGIGALFALPASSVSKVSTRMAGIQEAEAR